jgi:hypothetical protein
MPGLRQQDVAIGKARRGPTDGPGYLVHIEVDHHRYVDSSAQSQPRVPQRKDDIGENAPATSMIVRRMVHAATQVDTPASIYRYLQPDGSLRLLKHPPPCVIMIN